MEATFPTVLGILDALLDHVRIVHPRDGDGPTVAVEVHPEAAARIAELGLEAELRALLAYTRRVVRRLKAIEVSFVGGPDELGHFPYPLVVCAWVEPDTDQDVGAVRQRLVAWRNWRFLGKVSREIGFRVFPK
jgi:hypothetical protein